MKLKIQNPCSEDWDKMNPSDIGKFCEKCEKSIYDLSSKTDKEIISFFENKEEDICGRVTKFQLNHDFYTPAQVNSSAFGRYVAASFTLLALTPAVVAQNNDLNVRTLITVNKNIQSISIDTPVRQKTDFTIKLKDQEGNILAFTAGRTSGGENLFTTDSLGVARFNIPEDLKGQQITIYLESHKFKNGSFVFDTKSAVATQTINVEMYEIMMLGEMIPYEEDDIKPTKKECKPKK